MNIKYAPPFQRCLKATTDIMEHKNRDFIVGAFALIAVACFGWLVFMFGDLPGFVSKMDADIITIYFPEVPGIQESSAVLFKGYPVGKVIDISPPVVMENKTNPDQKMFSKVDVTISKEIFIPENIKPKIFQRGLGSSYIELTLPNEPSVNGLKNGDIFSGELSQGSEFISEATQIKLDSLIGSLSNLTQSLQSQLTTTTPEIVDNIDNDANANLTTAIMRLDTTLKSINDIVGNQQNQRNIINILEDLAEASSEAKLLVNSSNEYMKQTSENINNLVDSAGKTVNNIDTRTRLLTDTFNETALKAQTVEDELVLTIKSLRMVIEQATDGEGSIDSLLNDPSLYESLTDTARKLTITLEEMRSLLEIWQENGVKMKL